MKIPTPSRIGQNATSSVNDGPKHPTSQEFKDAHERIFGKKTTRKPGYTIYRYVNGKRIEIRDAELKSRSEVGLPPLKVESI